MRKGKIMRSLGIARKIYFFSTENEQSFPNNIQILSK